MKHTTNIKEVAKDVYLKSWKKFHKTHCAADVVETVLDEIICSELAKLIQTGYHESVVAEIDDCINELLCNELLPD